MVCLGAGQDRYEIVMALKILDLFSGIGGFSYAAEGLVGGYETVAFCESDEFCQKILNKHWPDVPVHNDVRTFDADRYDGIDVITAGFPCQDISVGKRDAEGIDGKRSGLWSEVTRIAGRIRPRWIVLENVPALLSRGMGRVIGDLASIGYDTQWQVIPATAIGAIHRRSRIWIVAHDPSNGIQGLPEIQIQGQQGFPWLKDVRRFEDIPRRSALYPSQLCRGNARVSKRLHAIGNTIVPQQAAMFLSAIKDTYNGQEK